LSDEDGSVMQRSILHHTSREAHLPESNETPLLSYLIGSAKTDDMSPEAYIISSPQPAPVVSVIKKDAPLSQSINSWDSRRQKDVITSADRQWTGVVRDNPRETAAKEILQDVQRYFISVISFLSGKFGIAQVKYFSHRDYGVEARSSVVELMGFCGIHICTAPHISSHRLKHRCSLRCMPSSVLFGEEWQIFSDSGLYSILVAINSNKRGGRHR
jgi:hypothetical protein